MRLIALMNQKGGVGKTTTTVNLAAALAHAGHPTLIVDLDPQAHATLHLGVEPGSGATVYDLLLNPAAPSDPAIRAAAPNLWLLPSTTDLAAAEIELAPETDRIQRLTRIFAGLTRRYDYILIDCPPSLNVLTLNGLAAARHVLIPMQAHFLALQGVGKLLETVNLVRENFNPGLSVLGVVLCMHDATSTHAREVVADIESFFEQARGQAGAYSDAHVLKPPIRRNIKLAECPSFGKTIFDYAPDAPGAADYAALARNLEELVAAAGDALPAVTVVPARAPERTA